MEIIIYAQSLEDKNFGNIFYKGNYLFEEPDDLNLTDFFINIRILSDFDNKDFENVRYKYKGKYLYVYIPCIEKDTSNRYSPIILETHYEDIDDVRESLNIFLKNSKRHITKDVERQIIQAIESFKEYRYMVKKQKIMLCTTIAITTCAIFCYMLLKR